MADPIPARHLAHFAPGARFASRPHLTHTRSRVGNPKEWWYTLSLGEALNCQASMPFTPERVWRALRGE